MDEQTQDLDELTPESGTDDAPATDTLEGAESGAESGAVATAVAGEPGEAPLTDGAVDEAPVRPREIIKGIHPDLKCECPECAPEFTELQWFSPEEEKKTKGQVMLYCQRSSRKYFSPTVEFQAWVEKNKPVGKQRKKD